MAQDPSNHFHDGGIQGKVIFEYGDTTLATNVASVRKSVLDILFAAELKNLPDNLNN